MIRFGVCTYLYDYLDDLRLGEKRAEAEVSGALAEIVEADVHGSLHDVTTRTTLPCGAFSAQKRKGKLCFF